MTDLQPCPFCGGEVNITYNSADNVFSIWHKYDGCKFIEPMYIDGEYAKSLSDARNIWNKRSVPWWDKDALSMDDPEIIGSHTKKQLLAKMDGIIELAATKGNATVACTLYEVQNRYRDMPEIIRCKDCKYNNPFGCMKLQMIVGDDWFCASGEHK